MVGLTLVVALPAQSADGPLPDGLDEQTAAGSCWEIKQNYPSSANGQYWLLTPALGAPQQFYCDMTTDGGGWVLIGRGREGWQSTYQGVGTAAEVRGTVEGQGAFSPAQLDSRLVDQLLDGNRVDSLTDGVRVRRAADTAGTSWQEVRFRFTSRDRWVWTFGAEHRVATYSFDGATGSGGQTNNFGNNSGLRRVDTSRNADQGWLWGWSYGSQITGTTAAGSYLWSSVNGRGAARPFAQVYLRPQLRLADFEFDGVPDEGSPKQEQRVLQSNYAAPTVWGVSGLANGSGGEHNTEAQAFAQIGNTVYVGGNFRYVQRTRAGADQVQQSYVAGFDVNTGEWISSFRPILNGQIKALEALPDGRLAIGGQFSTVNGTVQRSLAFLDPVSGQLSGNQVLLENRTAVGVVQVRGLAIHEGLLYVAGAFSHLTGDGVTASAWNGARIQTGTGRPDLVWNPLLNGTSVGVDASSRGDRAYFSGFFSTAKGQTQRSGAALQSAAGAELISWTPVFSRELNGNVWQLGVREEGDRVWLGGSEHSLFSYSRDTLELLTGNITYFNGDFQDVWSANGTVYGGCHCGDWQYSNSYTWPSVGTGWTQADKIDTVGAWDAATGDYLPDWAPYVKPRAGYGTWGIFTDSTGTLWIGGDIDTTARGNRAYQWSGGFARYSMRDATAPTTPGNLRGTVDSAGVASLAWNASSDASAVRYEVLVGDRVVRTVTGTTTTVNLPGGASRVFVRAIDTSGNRSASTPVLHLTSGPVEPDGHLVVPFGSEWRWRYDSAPLPTGWAGLGFDDSAWQTGRAVLGMEVPGQATDITPAGTRPLSAQFRTTFEVDDLDEVGGATVRALANDAVIVYVNGVEVGRSNLPAGAIGQNSYALSSPRHATALANLAVFEVPRSVLRTGVNVVAAQTNLGYRATPDVSFDLELETAAGDPLPAPPGEFALQGEVVDDGVRLTWDAPGTGEVVRFTIDRDGELLAEVAGNIRTFTDTGATGGATHTYAVVGHDAFDRASPAAQVSVEVPEAPEPEPEPVEREAVASNASWRWQFIENGWVAGWQTPEFDDASWSIGDGALGFGSPLVSTDISVGAPSPRPISAQFRHEFGLENLSAIQSARLELVADDGAVIYLNGTELGRVRMPAGSLTAATYPTASVATATAMNNPTVFDVPLELLESGSNVLAASTHLGWRATPNVSFRAVLTLEELP